MTSATVTHQREESIIETITANYKETAGLHERRREQLIQNIGNQIDPDANIKLPDGPSKFDLQADPLAEPLYLPNERIQPLIPLEKCVGYTFKEIVTEIKEIPYEQLDSSRYGNKPSFVSDTATKAKHSTCVARTSKDFVVQKWQYFGPRRRKEIPSRFKIDVASFWVSRELGFAGVSPRLLLCGFAEHEGNLTTLPCSQRNASNPQQFLHEQARTGKTTESWAVYERGHEFHGVRNQEKTNNANSALGYKLARQVGDAASLGLALFDLKCTNVVLNDFGAPLLIDINVGQSTEESALWFESLTTPLAAFATITALTQFFLISIWSLREKHTSAVKWDFVTKNPNGEHCRMFKKAGFLGQIGHVILFLWGKYSDDFNYFSRFESTMRKEDAQAFTNIIKKFYDRTLYYRNASYENLVQRGKTWDPSDLIFESETANSLNTFFYPIDNPNHPAAPATMFHALSQTIENLRKHLPKYQDHPDSASIIKEYNIWPLPTTRCLQKKYAVDFLDQITFPLQIKTDLDLYTDEVDGALKADQNINPCSTQCKRPCMPNESPERGICLRNICIQPAWARSILTIYMATPQPALYIYKSFFDDPVFMPILPFPSKEKPSPNLELLHREIDMYAIKKLELLDVFHALGQAENTFECMLALGSASNRNYRARNGSERVETAEKILKDAFWKRRRRFLEMNASGPDVSKPSDEGSSRTWPDEFLDQRGRLNCDWLSLAWSSARAERAQFAMLNGVIESMGFQANAVAHLARHSGLMIPPQIADDAVAMLSWARRLFGRGWLDRFSDKR